MLARRWLLLFILIIPSITYAIDIRFVKVLLDSGSGGIYNGALSISELEILSSDGFNYAPSSMVFATSYYGVRYPVKAIDGTTSTIFATGDNTGLSPGGAQWLLVDLGTVRSITTIKLSTSLSYNSAALTDYRILTSVDGGTYDMAATVSGSSPIARTDVHSFSQDFQNDTSQGYLEIDMQIIIGFFILFIMVIFLRQIF